VGAGGASCVKCGDRVLDESLLGVLVGAEHDDGLAVGREALDAERTAGSPETRAPVRREDVRVWGKACTVAREPAAIGRDGQSASCASVRTFRDAGSRLVTRVSSSKRSRCGLAHVMYESSEMSIRTLLVGSRRVRERVLFDPECSWKLRSQTPSGEWQLPA
jgi:hypothetical protein